MILADRKKPVALNTMSFDNAIKNGVTLVDFWASWCGPCRMQEPILNDVAVEIGDSALIAKLNVDDNRAVAAKYGIKSIPSLIIFKNGKPVKMFTGVQPKQTLINAVKSLIS